MGANLSSRQTRPYRNQQLRPKATKRRQIRRRWSFPESFESATVDGLGDTKGFHGTTFAHGTFDTRELAGKPIVVNFWFPSCPPCRAELGHFENVYQQFGEPSGGDVQFVGIQQLGLDSIEDGAELFDEVGVTYPGLPDNGSAIQIGYNIFSYPTTVFLDRVITMSIGYGKVRSTKRT